MRIIIIIIIIIITNDISHMYINHTTTDTIHDMIFASQKTDGRERGTDRGRNCDISRVNASEINTESDETYKTDVCTCRWSL